MKHVYWIGGGSGAGKTTIARCLAEKYRFHLYSTDDTMSDHSKRTFPEESPYLYEFIKMDMDERWVNRSPKVMLETFHWFRGEGFNLIVEDLLNLSQEPVVIVEGFRLLPALVKPLLADPKRAVWLLPTLDFRKAVLNSRRGSAQDFIGKTSNPERALNNLLERDELFTAHLEEETKRLELSSLRINTAMNEEELWKQVTEVFRL